ncbi:MAG: hypothetical protein IKO97_04345 [Erysipelotrichaceae bacterium]|jgi:hypothetical protein|nr:hypothetical protein [Erysipelotrichaceae bacterium]
MEEKEVKKIKLVPAVCTQCGAALEVDPSQEAAVCKFCNTPFIVEKAINNYTVQHANIEHADNVTIDLKGSVNSVLDFAGKQLEKSREASRERRRLEHEESKVMMATMWKWMGIMMVAMMIIWAIMTIFNLW